MNEALPSLLPRASVAAWLALLCAAPTPAKGVPALSQEAPVAAPAAPSPALRQAKTPELPTTRTIGTVREADGSPAPAGTRVIAIGRLSPDVSGEQAPLRFETELRRGGRFILELPNAGCFSIWAEHREPATAKDPAPPRRFSNEIPELDFGDLPELELHKDPSPDQTLRIQGLEAWKARGPFTVRAVANSPYAAPRTLQADGSGGYLLPAIPGTRAFVELWDKEGQRLQAWQFFPNQPPEGPLVLELHAPVAVPFTVLDKASGKAIPGAGVLYRAGHNYRRGAAWFGESSSETILCRAGRTDEQGKLAAQLPIQWTDRSNNKFQFYVEAPGYVRAAVQLSKTQEADFELEQRDGKPPAITVKLNKSVVLEGRVLDGEGQPLAGLPLLYKKRAVYYLRENGMWWTTLGWSIATTNAEGCYTVDGLTPNHDHALIALPSPAQRMRMAAHLEKQLGGLLPGGPISVYHKNLPAKAETKDVGDFESKKLTALRLRILAPGGRPARNAQIHFRPQIGGETMRLQADRRGRAAAIVPTGSYELIAFARGSGWVHRKLDTAELSSQENPLELTFGPWNYVRGRVIDVDGKGIANASIRSAGSSYSGNIPYLLRNVSSLMRHAKSDANGSFELPFIGYSGMTFRLRASASRPGKSRLTSKDTVQVGTENLDDVEFVLTGK
jgi:hypothetical protein